MRRSVTWNDYAAESGRKWIIKHYLLVTTTTATDEPDYIYEYKLQDQIFADLTTSLS
jgi:hypothetical protein